MNDITHASFGLNRNTTTSGFRGFCGDERPDTVTDQDRRVLLRSCGLIRRPHPNEAAGDAKTAAGDEASVEALEAFALDLGLSDHLAAARTEWSAAFEALDGTSTLRSLRLRQGLSQRQLASALATSQPRIAEIEAGRQSMSLPFARRMAEVLKVSLDVLAKAETGKPRV